MENKYKRGKVYKISSSETDKVYIGSTIELTLARRLANHKKNFTSWRKGTGHFVGSFELLQYDNYEITLLENFPCNTKAELCAREAFYIDQHPNCTNIRKPPTGLSRNEYFRRYNNETEDTNVIVERVF